ncbi:11S globulin seed storage protein 2-like protein [Drosera capensis]
MPRTPKTHKQLSQPLFLVFLECSIAMASKKLLVAICFSLLVCFSSCQELRTRSERRRSIRAEECRFSSRKSTPTEKILSEGGVIEFWDEMEEQFRCAGVAAMRMVVQPRCLSLPSYQSSPRLVYIVQGEGLMGISFPGCPETYSAVSRRRESEWWRREEHLEREAEGRIFRDMHQKVHRFRQGDLIAIPAGAAHWCYNDRDVDVIAVAVHDLNNQANQLDQSLRMFFLAGGAPLTALTGQTRRTMGQENLMNIMNAFDPELMAEAFGVSMETMQKMQVQDGRGFIVRAETMRMLRPEGEEEEYEIIEGEEEIYGRRRGYEGAEAYRRRRIEGGEEAYWRRRGMRRGGWYDNALEETTSNGLEEAICAMKVRHNMNTRREADVYTRHGGRLNIVNENKLPLLRFLGMSAEKGHLFPNAIYAPHWEMHGHTMVYCTRGEARVQVVGSRGQLVMDEMMREGDMFIIPQYFACACRAGMDGFEFVSFKTTSLPKKSTMAGLTSVFRSMPLEVVMNSFLMSRTEAQDIKQMRAQQQQTYFLSPMMRSSSSPPASAVTTTSDLPEMSLSRTLSRASRNLSILSRNSPCPHLFCRLTTTDNWFSSPISSSHYPILPPRNWMVQFDRRGGGFVLCGIRTDFVLWEYLLRDLLQGPSALQQLRFSSSASSQSSEKENDQSTEEHKGADAELNGSAAQIEETADEKAAELDDESEEALKIRQKEIVAMQDKVLRTYAEMENVMDRAKREADNSKKFAIQGFAKSLLDVADHLGRASSAVKENFAKIDAATDTTGAVPLLKTLLEVDLMAGLSCCFILVFKKIGLEKYDPIHEHFDPNRHNAVFQVPDESKAPGTVALVLKVSFDVSCVPTPSYVCWSIFGLLGFIHDEQVLIWSLSAQDMGKKTWYNPGSLYDGIGRHSLMFSVG